VNKIYIIGIGYKPLDKRSTEILADAGTILVSERLFVVFKEYDSYPAVKEKVRVINKVDETMRFLRSHQGMQTIVLLGSGDPMFHGIGRQVLAEFGPDSVEIIPDLSSIQVAFSKIKETWDDAFLISLHGGIDPERRRRLPYDIDDVPSLLLKHGKIAILTDGKNNPAEIARRLLSLPHLSLLKLFVCERLGYPDDERITCGTPEQVAGQTFSDPNVVILVYAGDEQNGLDAGLRNRPPHFGLAEGEIRHARGLITKDEVRAVTIHKLRLPRRGKLWDIGAGSGSVSIEAARLSPGLKVYAVEKDEEQIANIEENKVRFGCTNMTTTGGEAPEALKDLPSPDRVFVGGSGGKLSGIIGAVNERMATGIIVINAVTLETLNEAVVLLEKSGFGVDISQVSISRSKVVNGQRHLAALNQISIIRGERK
jgi:precorrin-6B C5,15-methyltransferase / cobalt-precorrin-6B C5,C15-methyltransferase